MWRAATDDFAPAREAWRPIDDERIHYVLAKEGERVLTLFTLLPQNAVCWEFHMTRAWGAPLRPFFAWVFEHTPARRLVGAVAADNPIAIRALRRAGMQEYGRNPQSFMRGGELRDQVLFGVSKSWPQ